jgi:hypothetical protein
MPSLKHLKVRVACIVALLVVSGCDPIYGVERSAYIAKLPSEQCVIKSINLAEGAKFILHRKSEGEKPLTLSGVQEANKNYEYRYTYQATTGSIHFIQDYKGDVLVTQSLLSMGGPPPQFMIDQIRPGMAMIEKSLEKNCSLPGFASSIKENCSMVDCPPTYMAK